LSDIATVSNVQDRAVQIVRFREISVVSDSGFGAVFTAVAPNFASLIITPTVYYDFGPFWNFLLPPRPSSFISAVYIYTARTISPI